MVGKKKRGHPDIEDLLARPWCYYCERDFDDLKILISHQKAKHFKCERCGRRLNTAGGLSVHMNQVHKETLTNVENALPNRQGLEVEIFGMEGIPEDVAQAHNQRIIAGYYEAEAHRRATSGNNGPGGGGAGQAKKPKFESPSDLKKRLAEHKARKAEQAAQTNSGANTPAEVTDSPQPTTSGVFNGSPYNAPQPTFSVQQNAPPGSFPQEPYVQPQVGYQQPPAVAHGAPYHPQFSPPPQFPQQQFPASGFQQPPHHFPGGMPPYAGSPPAFGAYQPPHSYAPPQHAGIPNRPPSLPPPPGLPQRPSFGAPPVLPHQMQHLHQGGQHFNQQNSWNGNNSAGYSQPPGYGDSSNKASTVDDLIAGAAREPDEVDEAIRRAIEGVKPPKPEVAVPVAPMPTAAPVVVSETSSASQPTSQMAEPLKAEPAEKKSKKDKAVKMVYSDNEVSPEERMAKFARYAFVPEIQA